MDACSRTIHSSASTLQPHLHANAYLHGDAPVCRHFSVHVLLHAHLRMHGYVRVPNIDACAWASVHAHTHVLEHVFAKERVHVAGAYTRASAHVMLHMYWFSLSDQPDVSVYIKYVDARVPFHVSVCVYAHVHVQVRHVSISSHVRVRTYVHVFVHVPSRAYVEKGTTSPSNSTM